MAKYYGQIGFAELVETSAGVWVENIIEKEVYGEMLRFSRSLNNSSNVNDDINISNEISILADPYIVDNIQQMRYATFCGTKWKISSVNVNDYPRINISLGGMYRD